MKQGCGGGASSFTAASSTSEISKGTGSWSCDSESDMKSTDLNSDQHVRPLKKHKANGLFFGVSWDFFVFSNVENKKFGLKSGDAHSSLPGPCLKVQRGLLRKEALGSKLMSQNPQASPYRALTTSKSCSPFFSPLFELLLTKITVLLA